MIVRRLPVYVQNGVVIGAGPRRAARRAQDPAAPEYGIKVVGFVDDNPRERRPEIADLPLLGELDDLAGFVEDKEVDRVIVAFSGDAATIGPCRSSVRFATRTSSSISCRGSSSSSGRGPTSTCSRVCR